ncbi:hypothetical protein MYX82_08710 [Acidobacteria bacterium AH-259-D05]|nr:hypothetical protein [Acidobacteria bacterium AH-259-D05]
MRFWLANFRKVGIGYDVVLRGSFLANVVVTERQPQSFDLTGWKIDHTRMVTEFVQGMTARGLAPQVEFSFTIAAGDTTISGNGLDLLPRFPQRRPRHLLQGGEACRVSRTNPNNITNRSRGHGAW